MEQTGGIGRRDFGRAAMTSALALQTFTVAAAETRETDKSTIIDTHMHVWGNDPVKFPYVHPYDKNFQKPLHEGTVEMLVEEMDRFGCTHAVLVQVIFHGWDNSYVAEAAKRFPDRFQVHGLIDPADPKVADKLEYWMKEHGLAGMRFSPIYYEKGNHGGDGWLAAKETHRLWEVAEKLGAVFNFFIAPHQLPRLGTMVVAHPSVKVVIDHLGRVNLAGNETELRYLLEMARHPNVAVKVSELAAVSKSKEYPFADTFPAVKRVYEAFGPDRLLFGTGYPGAARSAYGAPTLAQELALIQKEIPCFRTEDRWKILGRSAARIWGF